MPRKEATGWVVTRASALRLCGPAPSRTGTVRLLNYAFALAASRPRRRITLATKSNGNAVSMPWWDRCGQEAAQRFPGVAIDHQHIDILCARLVLQPDRFDGIGATHLFGDILSDLGPATTGTIGIAALIRPTPAPSIMSPPGPAQAQ